MYNISIFNFWRLFYCWSKVKTILHIIRDKKSIVCFFYYSLLFFSSISNRKTFYSNNTPRSLVSDQDLEVEKPKKKKKRNKKGRKKRRVPRTTEYDQNVDDEHIYEDLPTSTPRAMPPSYTSLPKSLKPLPKRFKTPSEASFATNSTYVRSRTDQSNSGGFSSGEYRKSQKEHAIKIDSDNEDLR